MWNPYIALDLLLQVQVRRVLIHHHEDTRGIRRIAGPRLSGLSPPLISCLLNGPDVFYNDLMFLGIKVLDTETHPGLAPALCEFFSDYFF